MNNYFQDFVGQTVRVGDVIAHCTRNGRLPAGTQITMRRYVVESIEDSGDGKYRKVKVRGWFRNGWSKSWGARSYVRLVKRTYGAIKIVDLSGLDPTEPCDAGLLERHKLLTSLREASER